CVGATRSQVRRSVLIEAGAVGLVASAMGLGLGTLLAQTALWVVPALDLAVPAPSVVTLSVATVAWPLATGTAVTVLAALAPARLATRVAPLAALRPLELTPVRKSSRVRLVLALLGVVGGGGILALATFAALTFDRADPTLFVLAGIFGGAVSVTGVLIGAVYFVPGVARMLGSLAARAGGVPGKVAAANSVRNPRRTTATASALLIGAGLVTMMATGAATARGSLASLLDEVFPVDVAVQAPWNASGVGSLTATQVAAVESTDGVARTEPVEAITVTVVAGGDTWSGETAYTASAEGIRAVSRTGAVELPEPGTTAVPAWMDVMEGETVTVTLGEKSVELVNDPDVMGQLWLAEEDLARLGGETVTTALWGSLEPDADPRDVTSNLRDTFTELSSTVGDPPAEILGAAVERAGYEEVIDTLLAIVVGLLGVAVVIALVGVANTLSLSVLERRRESATLRAIGLRKAQLRQMLAIEGVIIAVVGAALGAVLGIVYGWTGSALILGSSGGLRLAVPWRDLAIILAVAVAAGLLPSVLPSRPGTRTPPGAALAVDWFPGTGRGLRAGGRPSVMLAAVRVTFLPPGSGPVDLELTVGVPLGSLRTGIAAVTGCPDAAHAPLAVGSRVLDDAHLAGTFPLVAGARLSLGPVRSDDDGVLAAVRAPRRPAVREGPEAGLLWPVPERLAVGREERASDALVLADPRVSQRHLELRTALGRVWVRDLGSANGSRLSPAWAGHRLTLPLPRSWTLWRTGDLVLLGETVLELRAADAPRARRGGRRLALAATALAPALGSLALVAGTGNPAMLALGLAGAPLAALAHRLAPEREEDGPREQHPGHLAPVRAVDLAERSARGALTGEPPVPDGTLSRLAPTGTLAVLGPRAREVAATLVLAAAPGRVEVHGAHERWAWTSWVE